MILLLLASLIAAICALPRRRAAFAAAVAEALRTMPSARGRTARRFATVPVTAPVTARHKGPRT